MRPRLFAGRGRRRWSRPTTEEKYARILAFLSSPDERARQQPEKDRATDEELAEVYRKVYETHGGRTIDVSHDDCRRAGVRAVAARVRQERCLVAQAVAMRAGVTISRTSERVPGTTGMWDVYVTRRPDVPGGVRVRRTHRRRPRGPGPHARGGVPSLT